MTVYHVFKVRVIRLDKYFVSLFLAMHYEKYSDVERTRLASLLRESVLTLCRNGIAAGPCVARVDGLIGVTLEDQRVVLVSIQEAFSVVSGEAGSASDLLVENSSDVPVHRSDSAEATKDPNVIQSRMPLGQFDADRMREQHSADLPTLHRTRVNNRVSISDLANRSQLTGNFQNVHCCEERIGSEVSRQQSGKPSAMTDAAAHDDEPGVEVEDAAENMLSANEMFAADIKVCPR
jgi:hypothetical protein